jgi:lysophospholipase L1-like esterase
MTRTDLNYIALGDSMSIDLYPDLDAGRAFDRAQHGLGAASLLFRNHDIIWPEFTGRDLMHWSRNPNIVCAASDAATLRTVGLSQVPLLSTFAADIVTLTVGGNDVLEMLDSERSEQGIARGVQRLSDDYRSIVKDIRALAPGAILILTTVYDPTDGSGVLFEGQAPLPMTLLEPFNEVVREAAANMEDTVLADVHSHFMGHGITAPVESRWYWRESIIEPSARGASEIRRLWIQALNQAGFAQKTGTMSRE